MAHIFTIPNPVQVCAGYDNVNAYEEELNLSSESNSHWVMVPEDVSSISVTISFTGGGRGKVQTSTDLFRKVQSGSLEIVPVDWSLGVVEDTIQDQVVPVTALRLVQTSSGGACKLSIRMQ